MQYKQLACRQHHVVTTMGLQPGTECCQLVNIVCGCALLVYPFRSSGRLGPAALSVTAAVKRRCGLRPGVRSAASEGKEFGVAYASRALAKMLASPHAVSGEQAFVAATPTPLRALSSTHCNEAS